MYMLGYLFRGDVSTFKKHGTTGRLGSNKLNNNNNSDNSWQWVSMTYVPETGDAFMCHKPDKAKAGPIILRGEQEAQKGQVP